MPLKLFITKRPQPDSRAAPIVLGVTGHRDVREADVPRLRRRRLPSLRGLSGATATRPWCCSAPWRKGPINYAWP